MVCDHAAHVQGLHARRLIPCRPHECRQGMLAAVAAGCRQDKVKKGVVQRKELSCSQLSCCGGGYAACIARCLRRVAMHPGHCRPLAVRHCAKYTWCPSGPACCAAATGMHMADEWMTCAVFLTAGGPGLMEVCTGDPPHGRTRAAQVRGQSRAWVLSAWMEVRLCWSET
jgi:hypothetical protein